LLDAAMLGLQVGQEPGWYVEAVPGGVLTVALDYGERVLTAPTPAVTQLQGARGYQAEDVDGRLLLVLVEPIVCFDIMSGEVYPETVTVAVGDDRYRGCGVRL
jgi:putative lipoprotein